MLKKFLPPPPFRDQFSQIFFTISLVTSLIFKTAPTLTVLMFAISLLWGLLTLPTLYLEKLILDKLVANIGNSAWQQALYPLVFLVFARVLLDGMKSVLSGILGFVRRFASRSFLIYIETLLAEKFASLDAKTIEDPQFQDRFNKVERESGRRAWGLMMPFVDIPNYVAGFLSSVGILWFLHPVVALGTVLVALPLVLVDRKFIKREYELETKMSPLYRVGGWIGWYLTRAKSFLEVRILRLSGYLTEKMKNTQQQVLAEEYKLHREKEGSRGLAYLPGIIFTFLVNIYLLSLTLTKQITVGSFEMFLRALLSSMQNFSGLANSFLEIYENYVFVEDLSWFLKLLPQIEQKPDAAKLSRIGYSLEMDDIWFKYKKDDPWILKGVNLKFVPGEKVAIVGENGAGKSTLIKILARFYDTQKGQVLVDGGDIKSLDLVSYQGKFAILFQNFETYPFTARESIGYGDVERVGDLPEIKKAARKTDIDEFIENLPLKYENPLDPSFPKGISPSLGQWQRIGIARVLFREGAEVLILDEPTSNVDPEAEEKIFNELLKKSDSKILIFISQRFSTVRRADRIVVVDKGKIIEEGTHEQLMKLNGKYTRLFTLQAKGYQ